jgi:hypothetical protein
MSLAFYASPIDYKNSDLETKLNSEKNKLNKGMLSNIKQDLSSNSLNIAEIHKNLKEDNDKELSNFYKSEIEPQKIEPPIKANYMLINGETPHKPTNNEMLIKLNNILEMFEDQKEIKTSQKNEEIVLYCFLGVFVIYVLDSFVNIGKYSR